MLLLGSVLDAHKPAVKDDQETPTDEDLPEELKLVGSGVVGEPWGCQAAKGIYDIGPRVRKERFQLVEDHPAPRKKRARVVVLGEAFTTLCLSESSTLADTIECHSEYDTRLYSPR